MEGTLYKEEVERIASDYVKMAFAMTVKPILKELLEKRLKSYPSRLNEIDVVNVRLVAHNIADCLGKELSDQAYYRYKMRNRT